MKDNIIRLFGGGEEELPEIPLPPAPELPGFSVPPAEPGVDLSGKPRIVMVFGAGRSGKSTLLRWVCERAIQRDEPPVMASMDVHRSTLRQYFPSTMVPKSTVTSQVWLERLLGRLVATGKTAAIDFGADANLLSTLGPFPDLYGMAAAQGTEIVAFYLLTPRSSDLTLLRSHEDANFRPRATALVLNMGTAVSEDPEDEFGQIRRHSVYRAVRERGAVEVWMPKLFAAKAVEDRGIGFFEATNHAAGQASPLDWLDRPRVSVWLGLMEKSFAHVNSWLP